MYNFIFVVLLTAGITVVEKRHVILIRFTPTVPHCSFSTIIGLALLSALRSEFIVDGRWRVYIRVTSGSHMSEDELNRQFQDKERVAAALENPSILEVVSRMLERVIS